MADSTSTMSSTPMSGASQARGILTAEHTGAIDFAVIGTDYLLRLAVSTPLPPAEIGKRIVGTIRAQARRIDVVTTGGRFVEPVYGKPRRVQGQIIALDPNTDTLVVLAHTDLPFVCKTNGMQHAGDFKVGQLVSFDVAPGASFTRSV